MSWDVAPIGKRGRLSMKVLISGLAANDQLLRVDLSRFGAAPIAHLCSLSFEGRSAFSHQLEGQRWPKAMGLCQVRAQRPIKCGPNIEGRRIVLPAFNPCLWQRSQSIVCLDSQRSNHRLQPPVARLDLCFIKVVEFQRLRQSKDVLVAVVADQCSFDRIHRGFAADIPKSGKNFRIALASNDGTDI